MMRWQISRKPGFGIFVCAALLGTVALTLPNSADAQLNSFSKQDLVDYTAQNPFDRLAGWQAEGAGRSDRKSAGAFVGRGVGRS